VMAPISARLATRGLQDRSGYDENISRTSTATGPHTAFWVSATVTTNGDRCHNCCPPEGANAIFRLRIRGQESALEGGARGRTA
jgi:hypothetical protein